MEILEVPFPLLGDNQIMVRNYYSVISPGTEGKTVSDARKGYIAKAKSRKKELQLVIDMVKAQGIKSAYGLVMNKLEAASPLGYSCAGEVIAVGKSVKEIKVGDYVACGGQGAYHADVVCVEKHLCVKVPESVSLSEAAFATIASIAIQGIRQAEIQVGEIVGIIGLGLIGQLTIKLLNAAGIRALGIDVNPVQVEIAKNNGAYLALTRRQEGIENIIKSTTRGNGVDAVIITAGTNSLDPVNFAGAISRKKGKVVIVGAVPTGFDRADYYKKELSLRMSSSYGPGRYDSEYEEKGKDYPIGYVRWTENRNMQSFVDLLADGKLNIQDLITHTFDIDDAGDAYQMILDKVEHYIGILIKYGIESPIKSTVKMREKSFAMEEVNVAFIGAGNFAQNLLLPRLKKNSLCNFVGVLSGHGNTSRYVGDKYGFNYCTNDVDEILNDKEVNTVFICSRHDTHAKYVVEAIKAGKNVFVEKPLALNMEELETIKEIYDLANVPPRVMLGFNRRFAPCIQEVKKIFLPEQPKGIIIRVNAGAMPKEHWVHDPEMGGGRIVGEACHFIDLAMYLADSHVTKVTAIPVKSADNLNDSIIVNISFVNGSAATIAYLSNGNKRVTKEYIEIFCDGTIVQIDDFMSMKIFGKNQKTKKYSQDKGHEAELIAFCKSIKQGTDVPIPFEESYVAMKTTFDIINQL